MKLLLLSPSRKFGKKILKAIKIPQLGLHILASLTRNDVDNTLEEVGQDFNLTRERIRQIEEKALRKLKHSSRADKLRSFIEH